MAGPFDENEIQEYELVASVFILTFQYPEVELILTFFHCTIKCLYADGILENETLVALLTSDVARSVIPGGAATLDIVLIAIS